MQFVAQALCVAHLPPVTARYVQMLRQRGAAGLTGTVLWTKAEDDLLLAIAHEFSGRGAVVLAVAVGRGGDWCEGSRSPLPAQGPGSP